MDLLLNFEEVDPSMHERLAQAMKTDWKIDEDFVVGVVLMVGTACVMLSFLVLLCLVLGAHNGFAEEGLELLQVGPPRHCV